MFHISDDGKRRACGAKQMENCKFYSAEDPRHYEGAEAADAAAEEWSRRRAEEDGHGTLDRQVRYSFLREFAEQEKAFDESFAGFPTRFFNADLRGKLLRGEMPTDPEVLDRLDAVVDEEAEEFRAPVTADIVQRILSGEGPHGDGEPDKAALRDLRSRFREPDRMAVRLAAATTAPADGNLDGDDVQVLAEGMGIENLQPLTEKELRTLRTERGWMGFRDGNPVVITTSAMGTKNLAHYRFPYASDAKGNFLLMDSRTLVGLDRVRRRADVDLSRNLVSRATTAQRSRARLDALRALGALEDAQLEGANFMAQRKHVRESSGTVATAWMDKKNPDRVHQDMMRTTPLNRHFRKVEVDNDVDPAEFQDFERAYEEARAKLPPMPGGREPELKVRKLGKHKANGIYFPHRNVLAVDVRNSSSFVHEYGHALDYVAHGNASLRQEFRSITRDYARALPEPPAGGPKADYYNTPTEQMARLFEIYAHERLGVDNRLLDPGKFSRFDYAPYESDPDLKARGFAFLDKLFGKNG